MHQQRLPTFWSTESETVLSMFLFSNSSMGLLPAITAHLMTLCSTSISESAVTKNLTKIPLFKWPV